MAKVLFVLNPKHGPATAKIRGTIYESGLQSRGWVVDYVSISKVAGSPELNAYWKSEAQIIDVAKTYDIVYLLKINSYSFVRKLKRATSAKIVFDFTDALWRLNFRKSWIFLEEILAISDAVFTENEYVNEYALRYNPNVFKLAACTQVEKFDQARAVTPKREDGKIALGWIGSTTTVGAIHSISNQLRELASRHTHLELRLLGCEKQQVERELQGVKYSVLTEYNEDDMIREALNLDIGLFPSSSDMKDYRIRGALKAMIYMSAGVPPVCLNAGDPARIIEDGQNGVLIDKPQDWVKKIEALIQDPERRKRMGQKAYASIKNEHSLARVTDDLSEALRKVLVLGNKRNSPLSIFRKIGALANALVN